MLRRGDRRLDGKLVRCDYLGRKGKGKGRRKGAGERDFIHAAPVGRGEGRRIERSRMSGGLW